MFSFVSARSSWTSVALDRMCPSCLLFMQVISWAVFFFLPLLFFPPGPSPIILPPLQRTLPISVPLLPIVWLQDLVLHHCWLCSLGLCFLLECVQTSPDDSSQVLWAGRGSGPRGWLSSRSHCASCFVLFFFRRHKMILQIRLYQNRAGEGVL